jgi:hypothetical protein
MQRKADNDAPYLVLAHNLAEPPQVVAAVRALERAERTGDQAQRIRNSQPDASPPVVNG